MHSFRVRRLVALAVVSLVAVGIAATVAAVGGDDDGGDSQAATAASTTTSSLPEFGPVPTAGAGAVRTESGLVLPIVGGDDEAPEVLTPCARTQVEVADDVVAGAHVVLDPGHGGRETGAVGPNGIVEKELNLDVARRVARDLEALGATVVLTRTDDTRVTLRTRAEIARALRPLLFVSIHHNGGPTVPSDLPGTQVYHQVGVAEAERFAGLVFDAVRAELAPFSSTWSAGNTVGIRPRLDEVGEDYYGVLRGVEVPSVLVEALFISAAPDAQLLTRADVRDAEARAIAGAVVEWLEGDESGVQALPPLVADESAGGGGGTDGCEDPAELND